MNFRLYPLLGIYNPFAETEIHTDAIAVAGILLQKQNSGQCVPIAYYSQATNQAEHRYHSFELEMLAIVKTIERFHIYLYGLNFTVVTDCHALVFTADKANINPRIARWIMKLQNYKFKVLHRDGKKMTHVDALSRVIFAIETFPLEKELVYRQLQDHKIKSIAKKLESQDLEKFELIDGLVFRKGLDKSRFVILDSMIINMIRIYHDEMSHCRIEKTIQGIKNNYWGFALRKKVQNYIDNCIICLMSNSTTNSREGEMQITNTPSHPFEIMHVDHCGPMKGTLAGKKHILVAIDAFSRFTWLFPVKSTTSKETIQSLSSLFLTTAIPTTLITDRGTSFFSQDFANFVNNNKITHHKVAVAAPWANGVVEKVNNLIAASLRKTIDDINKWGIYVPTVQYVLNNTFHKSLKSSPAKILFGYDQASHADIKLVKFLNKVAKNDFNIQENCEQTRDIALETTRKLKEYNKVYYDKRHKKPSLYKEGDFVLIRNVIKPGDEKKLQPKYKGPYKVAKVLNKNRYVIRDIPGFNVTQRPYNSILSPDRIKHWIKPVSVVNICK